MNNIYNNQVKFHRHTTLELSSCYLMPVPFLVGCVEVMSWDEKVKKKKNLQEQKKYLCFLSPLFLAPSFTFKYCFRWKIKGISWFRYKKQNENKMPIIGPNVYLHYHLGSGDVVVVDSVGEIVASVWPGIGNRCGAIHLKFIVVVVSGGGGGNSTCQVKKQQPSLVKNK